MKSNDYAGFKPVSAFGLVSWQAFAAFLVMAIGPGILLSLVVLENFGYRQLNSWWRLLGLYRWATQRETNWGEIKRKRGGTAALAALALIGTVFTPFAFVKIALTDPSQWMACA